MVNARRDLVLPFPGELPLAFVDVRGAGALGARVLLEREPHRRRGPAGSPGAEGGFAGVLADVLSQALGRRWSAA